MKAAKWIGIALGVYVGIVVAFESLIGILQPATDTTLVITTTDGDGTANDRVLASLQSGGNLYVAANHWPRAWYRAALANPNVQVLFEGQKTARRAVPVSGAEYDRLQSEHGLPLAFRFVTGFPSREFLRLDPI